MEEATFVWFYLSLLLTWFVIGDRKALAQKYDGHLPVWVFLPPISLVTSVIALLNP